MLGFLIIAIIILIYLAIPPSIDWVYRDITGDCVRPYKVATTWIIIHYVYYKGNTIIYLSDPIKISWLQFKTRFIRWKRYT